MTYQRIRYNAYPAPGEYSSGKEYTERLRVQQSIPWPAYTVDVRDFGATGNGVADDTKAIQAALDALPTVSDATWLYSPRGGTVRLPAGVYVLSSTLTLPRGCTLMGDGSECTILLYTATTGDGVSFQRPNVAESRLPLICLSGFTVAVKHGVTHTSGSLVHIDSADSTPGLASRIEVDDVYCYAGYEGFRLRNIQGGFVRHCHAAGCRASGFVFRGFSTLLQMTDCYSSGNVSHGFDISGWAYCSAVACASDSNTGDGWHIEQQSGDGSQYSNDFQVGSEQSINALFTVNGLHGGRIEVFGIAGSTTVDGISLTNCQGVTLYPWIETNATATGYPLKITDSGTTYGITVVGGFLGTFASGAHRLSGAALVTFLNGNGDSSSTMGGQLKTVASTTSHAGFNLPSGTAPTSPADGDMWYDGTNVKFRVGGTTKTFTLT